MPRFLIKVDFIGARHKKVIKIDDDLWEGMTEEMREKALMDSCQEVVNNHVSAYWENLEDDE